MVNNALRAKTARSDRGFWGACPAWKTLQPDAVSDVVVAQLGLAASMKDTVVRMLAGLPDVAEFIAQRLFDGITHPTKRNAHNGEFSCGCATFCRR